MSVTLEVRVGRSAASGEVMKVVVTSKGRVLVVSVLTVLLTLADSI